MYLNIVDGFSGMIFSQSFPNICVGQNYRFSFSTRDAWSSSNNLTFNVYDNANVLLSTQTVINSSTWNDITMPSFIATTSTIRFEIVTNLAGGPGNDAGFDDLRLFQCQPTPINYTVTKCLGSPSFNLYEEQSGTILSTSGVWTGPTALQNGYSGTYNPATNTNGNYTYTIDGAVGCADSTAVFAVQVITTPVINPVAPIQGCQNAVLPTITGTSHLLLLTTPERMVREPHTQPALQYPAVKHFISMMVRQVVQMKNRLPSPFHNHTRPEVIMPQLIVYSPDCLI
jgi:hypothetical protein